ncbi:uncharacterized protein [Drosophila takahashii]|uniref:uncharacterized protein isoform X2 n=1 Tax=Drosophila takahashii TaxID=29030 RepID=UPI003898F715
MRRARNQLLGDISQSCCPIIMRSLRRGITSATAGGFRRISPNLLGQNFSSLPSWCPPLQQPSNNFVKNMGASHKYGNYLRFIEDPELPKLIKLYDRVCRDCHKKPVGSTKLRRSELDDPPKKHRHKSYFPKYTTGIGKIPFGSIKLKRSELDNLARKYWNKGNSSKFTIDVGNMDFPKDFIGVRRIPVGSAKLKRSEFDDSPRKYWNRSGIPQYNIDLGNIPLGSTKRKQFESDDRQRKDKSDSPNSLDKDYYTSNRPTIKSNSNQLETKKSERGLKNSEDFNNYNPNIPSKKSQKNGKSYKYSRNIKNGSPDKPRNPTKSKKKSLKRTLSKQTKTKTQINSNRNSVEKSQLPALESKRSMDSVERFLQNFRSSKIRESLKIGPKSINSSPHALKNSRLNLSKIASDSIKSNPYINESSENQPSRTLARSKKSSVFFLKNSHSIISKKESGNKLSKSDFIKKYRWSPFNIGGTKHLLKRYRTKPFKIGSHTFRSSQNNPYKIRKRSMKSSSHFLKNSQFKSASAKVSDDEISKKSINDDNSDKEETFNRNSMDFRGFLQSDNVSTLSWLPRIEFSNINPGPIDLIHFGPIDIETHKRDFLTLHKVNPAGKRGWYKIPWPNSFEPRKRNARIDDRQSALAKGRLLTKKLLEKTDSPPRRVFYSRKLSKYHSFRFEICPRKRRTPRKTVSCQTEVNRNTCELCDICRLNSQPDEPFMVEMKKRQNREALKSYYLKMNKRSKECCKEKVSEPNTSCKSNLSGMRHQLEQCLDMLSLCGRLIEDRLRLSRIETRCRP